MLLFRVADDDGVTAFCSEENISMRRVYIICSLNFVRAADDSVENNPYISVDLSLPLVVLISRILQTRVFTKQNYLCVCVNVCGVCVSFLDARTTRKR